MNANVWIPQNFNFYKNVTILKFWWIFLLLERGEFVVEEALYDVADMAVIRSKRHFWSEKIHYTPLVLELFCKIV